MNATYARLEQNLRDAETYFDALVAGFRLQEFLNEMFPDRKSIKP